MLPTKAVDTVAGLPPALPHAPAALPPEALLHRRRERLRMLPFVAASYVVDTALLCAYFAAGVIPWQMPAAYLACGLLLCAVSHAVLDSTLPERTRDHHLVMEQMVANSALAMAFMLWTPQVGVPLIWVLRHLRFGALRMKFRSVVWLDRARGGLGRCLSGQAVPVSTLRARRVSGLVRLVARPAFSDGPTCGHAERAARQSSAPWRGSGWPSATPGVWIAARSWPR